MLAPHVPRGQTRGKTSSPAAHCQRKGLFKVQTSGLLVFFDVIRALVGDGVSQIEIFCATVTICMPLLIDIMLKPRTCVIHIPHMLSVFSGFG